jgi:hypothetical protein
MGLVDYLTGDSEERKVRPLLNEIEYLAEEVRRLEVENFELRQELQLYESVLIDIQTGTPTGGVN